VDNSIRLKELQVVGGDLRKGNEGLEKFFFFFQKGFFWVSTKVGRINSTLFPKEFFLRD
jgi:hypothetical protein